MPRDSYAGYRAQLVEAVRKTGVRDLSVLRAIGEVPRHVFVPPAMLRQAYQDTSLPIGNGQTISQPSTQARALEALKLTGREKVLEVGTGSGYQTALLALVAGRAEKKSKPSMVT
ncbi:MAG: protein-L-isoaspartate O-methyltransferase, partial [candidate division NC10 bacterium]